MTSFSFWLNDTPPTFNRRGPIMHVLNRAIAQWRRDFGLMLRSVQGLPQDLDHVDVHVLLTFAVRRRRDVENYRPVLSKGLADALVDTGVIPDDTAEHFTLHVTLGPEPAMHRTTVTVEYTA